MAKPFFPWGFPSRTGSVAMLCALSLCVPASGQIGSGQAGKAALAPAKATPAHHDPTWRMMGREAHILADHESPAGVFPFETGVPGRSGTLVVAHYFPPFPLALDDAPADRDYYARHYLNPAGEGGKFTAQRGYLRDRPLPAPSHPIERIARANLALEVARASRIGIDAFGVDILSLGPKSRFEQAAFDLLDAAQAVSPTFRILPELDLAGLGNKSLEDMADFLFRFGAHPSALRLSDGRLLVMPLGPDRRPAKFWSDLDAEMKSRGCPIALAPDYIGTERVRDLLPLSWAVTIWGSRTPNAGTAHAAFQKALRDLGMQRWIAPVATQDYRPKDDLITEAHNSLAFRNQWNAALAGGSRMVHLITWNDYSESSHIAPSAFAQFVWYDLTAFHIAWLKRGSPPPIRRDALYYIYRPQIVSLTDAKRGNAQRKAGAYPLQNQIELVALLTAPGRLTIEIAGRKQARDVPAGLQTLQIGAAPGRPRFTLERAGKTVLDEEGDWMIEGHPARHDATYGGGSTTREIVRTPAF